jgi:type I restriction enzyme, S subunit
LPPYEEIREINKRVEEFNRFSEIIGQQIIQAETQTDKLEQSILAKAFRGELVPQNPEDEPASKLCDRIRAEREKLQTKTAKKAPIKQSSKKMLNSPNEWLSASESKESTQLELDLE